MSGLNSRGGLAHRSMGLGALFPNNVLADLYEGRYFKQVFPGPVPLGSAGTGYGDPVGTTAASNLLRFRGPFGGMDALYFIMGAGQTILAPFLNSVTGELDAGLDTAASEGVEYIPGVYQDAVRNPHFHTSGEVSADYPKLLRLKMRLTAVANAAECAIGWRKAAAPGAVIDDYTDMAVVNVQAGDVLVETILNNLATNTIDPSIAVVDDQLVEIECWLIGQKPEFRVDGVKLPTEDFSFDSGDSLIPFIHFLQGGGGGTDFLWKELEVGRLYHVDKDRNRR